MNGPVGNKVFCFPSTSMFPAELRQGTLKILEKQNSLFPLGPVVNCLLFLVILICNMNE